jgi:deferrochelatase/peroxidase EfeB
VTFPLPQFGIFAQGTHAHHFLEFDLQPGVTAAEAVGALRRLGTPDVSAGGVNLVIAFTYRGGRDITGFVDGTANRPVRRAADVALVGPGRAGQAGSHVLAMRWVHDLVAFDRLSVEDQQRVFGRTKTDSIELPPAEKPRTAHIARVETSVATVSPTSRVP